jgi:hypothetical protein
MNKKSSSKIITTGFIGAALAAILILSVGAAVVEEAEAKEKNPRQDKKNQDQAASKGLVGGSNCSISGDMFRAQNGEQSCGGKAEVKEEPKVKGGGSARFPEWS